MRRWTAGVAAAWIGVAGIAGCDRPGADGPTTLPSMAAASTTQPTLRPGPDGKVHLSEAEWKARLTPEQYRVLREKGTDAPYTNEYDHFFQPGTYVCAACGQTLFRSEQKYDSGCGWPAFSQAALSGAVLEVPDADGSRTEVECSRCGGHLGHVFANDPTSSTGTRYCIDSTSVRFVPDRPATRPAK